MAIIKLSAIVLLVVVCNAANVEIRCWSRTRDWCKIRDVMPDVDESDTITITNAEPKDTVRKFEWASPTKLSTMPSVWFETFPNLEVVDVSAMGLQTITQESLKNAHKLKSLIMDKNEICIVPNSVFKLATNLTEIDLDNNEIHTMADGCLTGLVNLKELHMDNNHIKTLTRNMLAGAPKLEIVHLTNNNIETIEEGALALPHLKELQLGINLIKTMPDNMLNGAPKLKILDISNNMLLKIPMALIMGKNKITQLSMDNNPLENTHITELLKMPSLETVSMEDTGIITKDIAKQMAMMTITTTSMINNLDLSDNEIEQIDILKELKIMPHLHTVILDKNKLTSLDMDDIKSKLPSLSVVSLESNEIDCDWLKTILPKMTEVDVELKTGDWDEDTPSDEQRKMVDDHLCGKIMW